MQKLLVICGPTATGKTALGVRLAGKFDGEVVSADSRQVYKGLDIATGKDIEDAQFRGGTWVIDNIPVWLLDVAEPAENFSIAKYHRLAHIAIEGIWKRGKLPILVGGTGLYVKAVVNGIDTLGIPPNPKLRNLYGRKSADELFNVLLHLDPGGANVLNASERKNKQRLLRRIEVAQSGTRSGVKNEWGKLNILMVGLVAARQVLRRRMDKRIDRWVRQGAEAELRKLLEQGISWDDQSISALGYRQWEPYFSGHKTKQEVVEKWKQEEWQYAKRQLTWFKKDKRIDWFDITNPKWTQKVDKLVKSWYYR